KRFAGKVTTASVKERREILSDLGKCVAGKDLPEGAVKGLCKLFCLTLHRYRDAASRRALQAAIQQLAEAQPEATAKNLLHSLQSSGIGSKAGVPSKSSGSAALLALTWTCLLVRIVFPSKAKRQGDIWNKLVEVQCLLLLEVLGGSHKHAVDGAVKKLTKLWKENPGLVEQYLSAILSLEPNQNYAGMLGLLVHFCTSHKEADVVNRHKSALLDFYVKNVLMSKVKPPKYLLDNCAPLLRYMSHSEFKDLVLPTIQKSLLRSPENVIETISSLLASVTLDLSQYALDIVKGLANQLKSNSPRLMDEAVLALRNLARQCSDSSATEALTRHLFAILGGSEGKLTIVAQKISVLSGIGSISHHLVSGSSGQVLNGTVAELFIPFLQQEVHEGTLVHAVSILALWCNRFTAEVPKKLTDWFKKAFSLKTSTSAVRHAYLQCMLASFRGDMLLQALDLLPLLIQTVEKAGSQSTQVPAVTEGVAAALLLSKLSVADSQAEAKLNSFWQLVVDEKKQIFTSEKFLLMASEDALCTVLHLTERLFLDHSHRLTGSKVQQYHRALVAVLLSRTWHVRRQAQQTVRKLLSSLGGFKLACGLLEELKTVLSSHKVLPLETLVTDTGEVTETGKTYVPPRVLQEALCVISGVPGLDGDITNMEQLAQEMLIISHHPSLVAVQSGLWPALLAKMKIDPEAFITRHLDQIIPRITTQSPLNQSSMNAMGSLSILSPDRVLPQLISTITTSVQNPALRLVTREEFAIMQTPAGELYDKSIIQSAQQDSIKKANMKRENKAYSFKEQIIELELKEEIKKKKGIKEEVQLTSKQKEMLQAQLDKEAQIRRRLQELDGELEAALGLLDTILAKNPSGLTQYIPVLVDSFLPLLKSPLAAPRIKNPFLSLAGCVMPPRLKALGTLVSHVTLRLLKPECALDKSWCQEELSVAVKRAVTLLHTHTITSRVGKGEPDAAPLSAPAFSLVFPLLKMVLTEMPHHSEEEEERMAQILQILTVHAQLRASPSTPPGRVDENGPELLPRVAMLRLLTWVIGTGSRRIQVLASDTLTTLCASSSGEDGCAFAEQEEVDVLLCALQSPCTSVRETALRGLMELHMVLPTPDTDEKNGLNLLRRLWVIKFDKEEEIRKLAEMLWSTMGLDLQPDLCSLLIDDVIYHEAAVRQAGAEALSQAVAQYHRHAAEVMGRLMEIYQEKLYRPPPVLDALGRVISESPPDQWEASPRMSSLASSSWDFRGEVLQALCSSAHFGLGILWLCCSMDLYIPASLLCGPIAIAPVLLDALTDPSRKTQKCLQTLLDTKFVHFIDAPSLALIMPIVQRAFQDRSTDTRKMAAQIIGNMYSLTDQKDLAPYLPSVTPGLKASLLDPVPEVRTVSAKALGAMVKGMGESCFEDLLPWLMETLTYEQSSVDRSGAAQGLAEVMAGLGVEKLEKLMPEIVATASKVDIAPHVRDGYIMMFNYLPITFGDKFTPYVGPIIPCILKALADENEFVRDTALRAGQRVISMYAETAIALLLPQLEQGLFDDLWRIRFSSVQLLGDLLFHISGVTGKMTTETASEDDNFGTAQSNKAIITALGVDRRNRVLAGLYMGRSDTQLVVRQASLHVWKIVVSNTPRTLREILPTLFGLLLGFLASTCADKRTIAARTLGDLVRKLGEKILPEIIPILEEGLRSQKSDERQGVCIGLSEIMKSTSRDAVLYFSESLVPTARKALCDPLEEVREAAAKTFEQLHSTIGHQALEDILPFLLKQLDDEEVSEFALDGLKQVMAIKSRVVLPYLVPKLTTPPVNTRVLAFLSSVAGDALTRHLGVILPAVMLALKEKLGTPDEQLEMANCQAVILSVEDDTGHRIIIEDLLEATRSPEVGMRQAAAIILNIYCSRSKADYTSHLRSLVSGLIRLFNDSNPVVLEESWDALNAITKKLDAGNQLALIEELHKEIRFIGNESKGEHVPGFCLPKKGVTSILPVLREGVLTGSPEQKEEAAKALGLVIRLTSADALRPSVVSITGPLIRILGDRFSWNVKAALLETLSLLLAKVGIALKPFLPQLQTTFTKALQDSNRGVRLKAADALGKLISIHIKVDPLFTELLNGIRVMEDPGVRDTMLQALRFVIQGAGAKVDAIIRKNIVSLLLSMLGHDEDNTRISSAGCLGELCAFLTEEELSTVLQQYLLADVSGIDWMVRHGRSLALSVAVNVAPRRLCTGRYSTEVQDMILSNAVADRIPIAVSGVRGMGFLMKYHIETGAGQLPAKLSSLFVKSLQNPSSDIRLVAEKMIWWANKDPLPPLDPQAIKPILKALLDNTKDKNTVVRAYSDQAIVNLLKMRQGEELFQALSKILDVASLEALNECNRRSLKKLASQADSTEQVDDTILT
uniref:GCN1 activator of EIF2AK4 n=1 Tax=Chinchilla lanigera TaxID=34839 RepID=A0A8C2VN10_CHILA